jgi:DNA primase
MRRRFYNRSPKRLKSYIIYEQQSINKLLFKINLSTVIGDYTVLKKTNSAYVGRCPVCKSLSYKENQLRVNDKLNIFKCYSCGIGGKTVAGFLMYYYNMPYDRILSFIQYNKKWNTKNNELVFKDNVVKKLRNIEYEDLPF